MADTIDIHLVGGPCDGYLEHISPDKFATKAFACGGVVYVYEKPNIYGDGYDYIPAADAEAQSARTQAFHPEAVAAAWHRFMYSLAVTGPRHIRRQHHAIARLRRLAR